MSTPTIHVGRLPALLAALGLAVAGLLLTPTPPAAAHATFVGSTPSQGEVLDTLPDSVALSFSEDMLEPAYVVVTAPDGRAVTAGEPSVLGPEVDQPLTDALGEEAAGTYTLAYRVVSTDGHPVTGQLTFSVEQASADGAGSAAAEGHTPEEHASAQPADTPADPSADTSSAGTSSAGTSSADIEQTAATTGGSESFWARHDGHVVVGAVLFLLAAGLLLASRRAT